MTISTTKMTARQFEMLGEDPPGLRLELVDGEIAVSPSPRPKHSWPLQMLSHLLLSHVLNHDLGMVLGDVDTVFGEYDVRRPDLIYYSKGRLHFIRESGPLEAPPDLCIEFISPSSIGTDRKDKFRQYAVGGVAYYWIVDPDKKTIEAHRLIGRKYKSMGKGENDQAVRLAPFPDLAIPLSRLWIPPGHE